MIDMVTTIAVLVLARCIVMAAYRVIAGPSQQWSAGGAHDRAGRLPLTGSVP
jgi:hypothetical protein